MAAVLDEVRGLISAELAGDLGGAALVERCTEVAERLQRAYGGEASVRHEVWHYLHDTDVRVRDRASAKAQLARVCALVAEAT
ncbi:MAG: hypothetical protein MUC96_14120 [Myxococcaceae bacterium]|jgi:hypothetical protein|nr:hypothetical protein [Myxococcaceae bacterium]